MAGIGEEVSPSDLVPVGAEVDPSQLGAATPPPPPEDDSFLTHVGRILRQTIATAVPVKPTLDAIYQAHGDPAQLIGNMVVGGIKAQGDQFKQAYQLYKQGRYVEAYGHTVAGALPVLGPIEADIAEKVGAGQGDEAVGEALGTGLQMAGSEVLPAAARDFPGVRRAMNAVRGIVEPGTPAFMADFMKSAPASRSAPYSPSDVQRAAPFFAAEHASAPITSVQSGIEAADSAIQQVEGHIDGLIQQFQHATIDTDPLAAARAALGKSPRESALSAGMKELDDLKLDQPVSLTQAENIRQQLNAENQAILANNKYDVATARRVDPTFAAREAAAKAIRDGIYDKLDELGAPGVRDLRLSEGSILRLRDAMQAQYYAGDRPVPRTGTNSVTASLIRAGVPVAAGGVGYEMGGPVAGSAGIVLGNELAKRMVPGNLTRDALMERAFSRLGPQPPVSLPTAPQPSPVRGLLPSAPIRLGGKPDTSFVAAVPAIPAPLNSARLLPSHEGIPLPASSIPLESQMQVTHARSYVVRDPVTGRFKRVYTSETK